MLLKFCEILFCGDYTSTLPRKLHLVMWTFFKHKHCCGEVCIVVTSDEKGRMYTRVGQFWNFFLYQTDRNMKYRVP